MVTAASKAWTDQSDIVVFSEMSLTAYYPGDMLDEEGFMDRVDAALQELLLASRQIPNLHWVVGLPARREAPGKKLRNALCVIKGGEVLLEYAKQLLPTYNIFDERRHFEPGQDVAKVLRIRDAKVGVLICEDGWNDEGLDYAVNPFRPHARRRARPGDFHQRQPVQHRQARAAPPHLRCRQQAQ
jgi:NAD+ synthase (glutamine-hydrolysing)